MFRFSFCVVVTFLSVLSVCEALFRPIVHGENAIIEEAPYSVHLKLYRNQQIIARGGGVIIAEKTLLTAAHVCKFWKEITLMLAHIGSTSRTSGGQNFKVESIISHPNYNNQTKDYDFCILKLKNPISFDKTKQPVKLPSPNEEIPDGELFLISGWGGTLNAKRTEVLQKIVLPKISLEQCQRRFKIKITDRMFCVLIPNSVDKTHTGDSGGPVVSLNDHKLYGLVSWGPRNKNVKAPSVYAKVSSVLEWIQRNMN